jgi:sugar lactone lactonase YvrE
VRQTSAQSGGLPQELSLAADTVFVAESCAESASCSPADGLVYRPYYGRPITDGVANPVAMTVDKSGNLYVSNAVTDKAGNVTVYAAGSGRLIRVLTGYRGNSYALAFSPSGDLFVVSDYIDGCCEIAGSVAVYAPGTSLPVRRLSDVAAFPGKPAFDASGNLYQPNFYTFPGFISVYAPGANTPHHTIREGIGFPMALTFDTRGQLYVLNNVFGGGSDILVYPRDCNVPSITITTGVSNPSAIALDSSGDLYVANRGQGDVPSSVSVYAHGASEPTRTIQTGIDVPVALAFDAAGNLYVANAPVKRENTVTVYAPEAETPEKVYRLAAAPTALAVP